eukprot:c38802_g1_i1 orf=350-1342(+)
MKPMNVYFLCLLSISLVSILHKVSGQAEGLEFGFYNITCPNAEAIARQTLSQNRLRDPTAPAALLRLSFHDCQVMGCDASILLKSTANMTAETASDKNFSIRKLDFIDRIKAALETACPNTVSCADIIIMAARDSIFLSGGPLIPIRTGRRDSVSASYASANEDLPSPTVTVDTMLDIFGEKEINTEDAVALLGAHTLGVSHCLNFQNRLTPTRDPIMPTFRYNILTVLCGLPKQVQGLKFAPNDATNFIFDNRYFKDLQAGRALLTIDSELASDPRTSGFVAKFSQDQNHFLERFSTAFQLLTNYNVLTGEQGQIRQKCGFVNPDSQLQ